MELSHDQDQAEPYRQVTADGCDTLYSVQYQQTFHSIHGALSETEHVFLEGTGVRERLAKGQPTCILEIGFETGLNFFVTAAYSRTARTPLHYVALEKELLPGQILAQLNHGELIEMAGDIRREFLEWRQKLPDQVSDSTLHWNFDQIVRLELILGDATLVEIPSRHYHAICHDAFSPAANPELWTQAFFAQLYPLLSPSGKLVTYSVKGTVRRNLQAAGFWVQKQSGSPGKREMLVAVR